MTAVMTIQESGSPVLSNCLATSLKSCRKGLSFDHPQKPTDVSYSDFIEPSFKIKLVRHCACAAFIHIRLSSLVCVYSTETSQCTCMDENLLTVL